MSLDSLPHQDQAIPLLLDRWGAWADTQGLLGPEDYIGSW